MYNKELAIEILKQIKDASNKILERFELVQDSESFSNSPAGIEKLDSICMQLIVLGENLKNFDKVTEHSVLKNYSQIDWKKAKGLRDIISHHYADINAEAIFNICSERIPHLEKTINMIIKDINQ